MDNRYIVSASEDTNIRLWKAKASDPMQTLLPREKQALAYSQKLISKFKHSKEVGRIVRHKHLPALIKKKKRTLTIQRESRHKKDINMRANNRPEDRPFIPLRKKDMDSKIE